MANLIEVRHLKKYFRTPGGMLHAVDDINFTLEEGKTLGVVGESGCGKSTLGRTILGLHDATEGEVLYRGMPTKGNSKKVQRELRRNMQLIFQDPFSSLNPRYCVSELIADPMKIYHMYHSKKELQDRVYELMDTVGLARRLAFAYPHELDGGRRQRIGIARALSLDPEFIVCDEPVSALDVSIQAQVLNLLQDLQDERGLTYMFITHDLSVVKHISDEIMVMYLGSVVELCGSRELFRRPLHPYTKGLLSAIPNVDIDAPRNRIYMQGELSSPVDPPPGCRFANRCPYAEDICRETTPELRDMGGGHMAACHLIEKINAAGGETT